MPLLLIGLVAGAGGTWWLTGSTGKLVRIVVVGGVAYAGYRYLTK